ncbi:PREDICTED: lysophosphatidic acid receptor 6-like [Gavialis gangeticus]|uniref:lysophosphatidic acid receptor 6-like n=1 Tax=Gavialis gangeticus TaxID=94835 RepID=UPI00092E90F0|nr:PREDICTED: lysophosphatidic acid receptor 6-like [Gavialis gangeticus]XP_019367375.1 PREDICTED: lysophosphatidic acid receptor 6-like [Gavialis gangeticus]
MASLPWTMAEGLSNETVNASLEVSFQYPLFTVIYSLVFVLGLIENILVLYLLASKVTHTSHSYIYIMNLAIVDTLFVCILPFKIHYHQNQNHWIFGDLACRITGTFYYINIYLSIAFFTCICIDRYIAVLHPFTYIKVKGTHYTVVVIALWLAAISIAVSLILEGPLHNSSTRNRTACFENFSVTSWTHRMVPYNVLALMLGFVIPFAIILISYPLIAKRISRIRHNMFKKKALKTIYVILFICTVSLLPYHLTHLFHFLAKAQVINNLQFISFIYKMRRVTLALVSFNCCLNPILYYFMSASKQWHFQIRLRSQPKEVYTICDRKLSNHSCFYQSKSEPKLESKNTRMKQTGLCKTR